MPTEETAAAFMERALFDPQHGYYSRNIQTVGARGDFSTSASLSPLLGKAAARWIAAESRLQPDVRTVIEVGGGDGSLMRSVRQELGWWRRRHFDFCMVETSPVLNARQRRTLGGSVRWFEDMQAALSHCGGRAFVYHNEFLDALPVALVQWEPPTGCWREVRLMHHAGGGIKEELRPLALDADFAERFSALKTWTRENPPPSARQRCELHIGVEQWLAGWGSQWKAGSMLAIDYGDTFPALYHRRPNGTLRAYLLHQRLEGLSVWQNAGRQDITTDINFTDLCGWYARAGCSEVKLETQAEFLDRHVPGARDAAGRFLVAPQGAGSAFKCLTARRARS